MDGTHFRLNSVQAPSIKGHTVSSDRVVLPAQVEQVAQTPVLQRVRPSARWGTPTPLTDFFPGHSKKISQQIIEGAIHHVLASKHSSFRELVTNAVDACKEGPPIGHFGMGFFSTLTYLDGGTIEVETRTDNEAYKMLLFQREGQIFVQFDRLDAGRTGTTVTINGTFSDENLANIQKDLQRLKIVQGAQITINDKTIYGKGPRVAVILERDRLQVQDWGTGIPLKTACTALLVPSSSSKTQKTGGTSACELINYREDTKPQAHLLVGVGGAVVVDLPLSCEHPEDLLLTLPDNTPVTLDRKSIQFAGPADQTVRALKTLIKQTVGEAAENPEKLALLHEALLAWEATADVPLSLSSLLKKKFDVFLEESGLVPYPLSHRKQLEPIFKALEARGIIPVSPSLLRYDYTPATNLITKLVNPHEDLVDLPVVFVPDDALTSISDCGLQTCLFAPESLLTSSKSKRDLAFRIATRYSEYGRRLCLHPSQQDQDKPSGPGLFFSNATQSIGSGRVRREKALKELIALAQHPAFKHVSEKTLETLWSKHKEWLQAVMKETQFLHEASSAKDGQTGDELYLRDDGTFWRLTWNDGSANEVAMQPPEVLKAFLSLALSHHGLLKTDQKTKTLFRDQQPIWPFTVPVSVETLEMVFAATLPIWSYEDLPPPDSLARFHPWSEPGYYPLNGAEMPSEQLLEATTAMGSLQETAALLTGQSLRGISIELAHTQQHLVERLKKTRQVARVQQMTALILGLLNNYFSIPDRDFPWVYGEERTSQPVTTSINLKLCKEAAETLDSFASNPACFEKLIAFVEQTFTANLSPTTRKAALSDKNPTSIASIAQLGPLAEIRALNSVVHHSHLASLIEYADTPEQLIVGCGLMWQLLLTRDPRIRKSLTIQPGTIEHASVSAAIETVMLVTIPRIPDLTEKIRAILRRRGMKYAVMLSSTTRKEHPKHIDPLVEFLVDRIGQESAVPKRSQLIAPDIQTALDKTDSFTAVQLFNSQSRGLRAALREGKLDLARSQIVAAPKKTDLQLYHHAIESGSARPIEEAFFLEALQNSLDAASDNSQHSISLGVSLKSDKHVILSESDTVGFPSLEVLLGAFLIPNQSPKRSGNSVGQMGNGSFQVYRKAQKVIVQTRCQDNPNKIVVLSIRPIRDTQGHVRDLRLRCEALDASSDPAFQGTRIDVQLQAQEPDKARLHALGSIAFIREVISTTDTRVEMSLDLDTSVELQAGIDRKHTLMGSGAPPLRFLKLKRPSQRGQLLTGGLPAGDLAAFLVNQGIAPKGITEEFASGWCLDLPISAFRPVQSRSEVRLKQERVQELKALFKDWLLYRATFDSSSWETAFQRIPHAESSVHDFLQVQPGLPPPKELSLAELPALMLHHRPTFLSKSLGELFSISYKTLVGALVDKREKYENRPIEHWEEVRRQFADEIENYFQSWKQWCLQAYASNETAERFIERVLVRWFEPKVIAFAESALPTLEALKQRNPHLRSKTEQTEHEKIRREVTASLTALTSDPKKLMETSLELARAGVALYCSSYAIQNGIDAPKVAIEFDPTDSFKAYHLDGTISVNLAQVPLSQLLMPLCQLARGVPLNHTSDPGRFFLVGTGQAGTLNHELEHARRHEECVSGGAHDPAHDAEGKAASFEACAASFARVAHCRGIFESVRAGMRRTIKHHGLDVNDLRKLLDTLQKLEARHASELQELLQESQRLRK